MGYRDSRRDDRDEHSHLPEDRRHDDFRSGYGGYDQQLAFSPSQSQYGSGDVSEQQARRSAGAGQPDRGYGHGENGLQRDYGFGRQEDDSRLAGYERDWGHDYHRDFPRDDAGRNSKFARDASGEDWGTRRTGQGSGLPFSGRPSRDAWDNAGARRGAGSDYDDYLTQERGGYGYGSWDRDDRWRDQPQARRTGMGGSAFESHRYESSSGHSGSQGNARHRDPDYHQWREEQIRQLDNDYEAWRQERYSKFSDEFTTWRQGRAQQPAQSGVSDSDAGTPQTTARPAGAASESSGTSNSRSRQEQQR